MEILFLILSLFLMTIGLAGVFLPFLPGVPLVWLGMFLYSAITNFTIISKTAVFIFLGFTALTIVVDIIAPLIGAKKYEASKYGFLGASLGLVFGFFIFGPFGIILGPLLGAVAGEMLSGKDTTKSFHTALGVLIGLFAGMLIKFIVVLAIIVYFIFALIF